MRTFFLTAVIAVQLLSNAIGIQAQNKPTLESYINAKMEVKHFQGNTMHSMGYAYELNKGFRDNLLPQGFERIGNHKAKEFKQGKSSLAGYQLLDSVIYEKKFGGSEWRLHSKDEYKYDANGNKIFFITYLRSEDNWIWYCSPKGAFIFCSDCEKYIYDDSGKLALYSTCQWDSLTNQLITSSKEEYKYDANGNMTLKIYYYLVDSLWYASNKYEYTYDTNSNKILFEEYYQVESDTQWIVYSKEKYSYTYDEGGNQTLFTTQSWEANQWVDYNKYEFAYDANGNQTLYQEYRWDIPVSQWVMVYKLISTYNLNEKTDLIGRYGSYGSYEDSIKINCSYNSNGEKTLEIVSRWLGSQWFLIREKEYDTKGNMTLNTYYGNGSETSFKEEYAFDNKGNKTLEINYSKDATTSQQWVAYDKTTWYYSDHSITNIPKTTETQLNVYPNPAKDFIVFDLTTSRESTIAIYDIQGKKVIEQKLNDGQVGVQNLPKGLYLYRLDDGLNIYTGKVIKE